MSDSIRVPFMVGRRQHWLTIDLRDLRFGVRDFRVPLVGPTGRRYRHVWVRVDVTFTTDSLPPVVSTISARTQTR